MLNLLEGCSCPQKTVYVVLAGSMLVHLLGIYAGSSKAGKPIKNFAVKFIVSLVIILIVFKLLEWMCSKYTKTWIIVAWVIALLPLLSYLLYGYASGMLNGNIFLLTSIPRLNY